MTTSQMDPWKRFVRAAKKPVWNAVHRLTGTRMAMTVHYLDMTMMGGVFRLDPEQAARLASNDRFVPSIAEDGLARCHVTALEYRDIDILYPYNEVAVTIPGRLRGAERETDLHFYLHLPVTTQDGAWPGVQIYGFPKYVAAIDFQDGETDRVCSLTLEGQEILELQVTKGPTHEDASETENLTFLEGEPLLSFFHAYGPHHASEVPGGAILRFGEHRLGRVLSSAQMELTSVSHFYCPGIKATLSPPVKLQAGSQRR